MKTIADRCFNILDSLTPESRIKASIISSYSNEQLSLNCYTCESIFRVIAKNLINKSLARCLSCRFIIPKGDSFLERFPELIKEWSPTNRVSLEKVWFQLEMIQFIKDLGINGKSSERLLISPFELDFYSQELGRAAEFNGDYFYSDKITFDRHGMSSFEYHSLKKQSCKTKKVFLVYVWESDWRYKNLFIKDELKEFFNTGHVGILLDILSKD